MEKNVEYGNDLNFNETELRLGLPGTEEKKEKTKTMQGSIKNNKRQLPQTSEESVSISKASTDQHVESAAAPPSK